MDQLLAASSDNSLALYIALGVGGILLLCGLWGGFRKFTRLTWIGWELLIAFAIDLALPAGMNFGVSLFLLIVISALPLVGEYFLRRALVTDQIVPARGVKNFFDHFGGVFTAIVGFLMFAVAFGGFVLALIGTLLPDVKAVANFMDNVPAFLFEHGLDFFLIAVFLVTMRAGCRLGVLKGLNFLLTLLLVFGSFLGLYLLFSQVGWGRSFASTVGGWFGMNGLIGSIVGCFTVTIFFSILCFVGIMFLSRFIDRSIQKANTHVAVAIPDALIVGVIYAVVFILIIVAIQGLFEQLAGGQFVSSLMEKFNLDSVDVSGMDSSVAGFGEKLISFARSSPLSQGLYSRLL